MGSQRGKIPSRKPCPLSPPSVGKEEEEEEEERPFFLIPRTLIFFFCAFSTSPSFLLSRPSPLVTSILLQPSMQPLLWRWGEEREGGGEDKLFPLSKEKPPPPPSCDRADSTRGLLLRGGGERTSVRGRERGTKSWTFVI